jgi:hypothetical protein
LERKSRKLIGSESLETYWSEKPGNLLERNACKLIGSVSLETYWSGKPGNLLSEKPWNLLEWKAWKLIGVKSLETYWVKSLETYWIEKPGLLLDSKIRNVIGAGNPKVKYQMIGETAVLGMEILALHVHCRYRNASLLTDPFLVHDLSLGL